MTGIATGATRSGIDASEENILSTTTDGDDGRSKMRRSHIERFPKFFVFGFNIFTNFLHFYTKIVTKNTLPLNF